MAARLSWRPQPWISKRKRRATPTTTAAVDDHASSVSATAMATAAMKITVSIGDIVHMHFRFSGSCPDLPLAQPGRE